MALFRKYYWVFGTSPKGKPVLLGPFNTEEEATEEGEDLEEAKVFPLKTSNQQKATRIVRRHLMKSGKSTDDALTRQLHETGLKRELGRGQKVEVRKKLVSTEEEIFVGDPFKDGE